MKGSVQYLTEKAISEQHLQMIWLAFGVNTAATIIIYFYFLEGNILALILGLSISMAIILGAILRKKDLISSQTLGIIPMLAMSMFFAYVYNNLVQLQHIREFSFFYMAIFVGGGMFLLLKPKCTIPILLGALVANAIFYNLYSYLTVKEILLNGGIAVMAMGLFMIVSVFMRFKLVVHDIKSTAELLKSKEKIIKSEAQNRMLFNKNPRPMLIYSLNDLMILDVNDTMVEEYGYTKNEFYKMSIADLRPDSDVKKVKTDVEDVKNGKEKIAEWVHTLKNGDKIDVEISAESIDYSGVKARLVLIKDITQEKINQKALEDAKLFAEKAKEDQSQFLSNMSHEIRTPMNGILGMSKLLLQTKQSGDQNKYTKAIHTSADNLMVIINSILDFSKIDAGKLSIETIPFNLKGLSNIWNETLKIAADEKGIGFSINIDHDVPESLLGDPIRLNQIIYNLGGNAIKFTNKGEVAIKISVIKNIKNSCTLQFDVRDNGIGIAEDKLQSIFSSFSQASSNTTRKYGGTGLGLTITKQLVDLQEGRIIVNSEEGEGSTFSVILNYGIQDSKEVPTEELNEDNNPTTLEGLNILLVEDHDINQMLATTVLEGWDFKVDLAENGEEAVEKVANDNYDIILMDIHMPKMDGYEATRQIRGKLNNQTPVIAMTASALIGDNEKCIEAGMDDYITKPFNPEILFEKIAQQMNKKSA